MKRVFFVAAFSLLCTAAFCQSLSIDEISAIVNQHAQANKAFFESKGFALCTECIGEGSVAAYQKNKGTSDEETLMFYAKSFDYTSHSLMFINTLMDQAKVKYKLVKTSQQDDPADDRKSFKSYWYNNGGVNMSFMIFKTFGIISVGH